MSEKVKDKVLLTKQEERFFYEYLRVAGDRSPRDCARDIAGILGSKSVEDIASFYQDTADLIFKDKADRSKIGNKKTHKLLTKFYDTRVLPLRAMGQKQLSTGDASAEKSPKISKKDDHAGSCEIKRLRDDNRMVTETDVCSQLQSSAYLEILFIPFDETLATTLSSSGCDPCPRIRYPHSEKIASIIDQLEKTWEPALLKLGKGSIRLKAPDNTSAAFKALSWGAKQRDQNLSLFDLMTALRIFSPSTLGYVWEEAAETTPIKIVQATDKIIDEKNNRENHSGKKSPTGEIHSDSISLAAFSPDSEHKVTDSKAKNGMGHLINKMVEERVPIGLDKLVKSESNKKRKRRPGENGKGSGAPITRKNNAAQSFDVHVGPDQLLRNAWVQYAGAMQQRNDYNMMHGKFLPQNLPPAPSRVKTPAENAPTYAEDREKSLLEFLRKEESKLGVSFGEVLKGLKTEISNPSGPGNSGGNMQITPVSRQKIDLDGLAGLSPPSSFKLPPEFHRVTAQNSTPIKSLCGIFDSCHPSPPTHEAKNDENGPPNPLAPKEMAGDIAGISAEILNPSMSILSLLDGISNSHWMSRLDEEKDLGQGATTVGNRPFANLFDSSS